LPDKKLLHLLFHLTGYDRLGHQFI